MRLHLRVSRNATQVPFDNIPVLVGTIHRWLGPNSWHSDIALHSFSWLRGAHVAPEGLRFPYGAEWFISAQDPAFIKRLIAGIQEDPQINYGMKVIHVVLQEDPVFGNAHMFTVASPVLIKRREGDRVRHYIYNDPEADEFLTKTLQTKLKKAGINSDGVHVSFNQDYPMPKTKLVNYNGIRNRASMCPINIHGTPEQIAFAWNVGVGNSTGIGFGALMA